jgi:hypothetical protein
MQETAHGQVKTTRFNREKSWFIRHRTGSKAMMLLVGFFATLWFLIRVIPKPSRVHYPCMQLAAPFASAFVLYIMGLGASVFAFNKLKYHLGKSHYSKVALFIIFLLTGLSLLLYNGTIKTSANVFSDNDTVNQPIGIARGIYPGRVVWVWNPESTNENCTNLPGDYWWQNENTNPQVVEEMLSAALRSMTGETTDSLAWDAIFRYYNSTHGNGNTGYTPGQKIVIKVNITTGGWGNVDENTYEKISLIDYMDSTPQLIVAMLKQLVEVVGVQQSDISVGDPIRLFFDHYWDLCHSIYPDVHYLDHLGRLGRTEVIKTSEPVVFYSDGTVSDSLPVAYIEAAYMINMGCLKQHDLAGGTFCAKNHFGSCCRDWASHLHYALPSPTSNGFENLGYGKFRNLVDLMEHKDLGEKTVLFVIDGIWGGDLPVCRPIKWQMSPFNDDWPSSLIISQDHVAIESVGFDFIKAEFSTYSHMYGADDYLHQAADSANWAKGITYDPDADGVLIASMGTHEHWNNKIDKQYSRNLGTGDGIELIQYFVTSVDEHSGGIPAQNRIICYPNPFSRKVTMIIKDERWTIPDKSVILYNSAMQPVREFQWTGHQPSLTIWRETLPGGIYYYNVFTIDHHSIGSGKLVIIG